MDDGSSDKTADIARTFSSVTVKSHGINRGYGASLKTGMMMATTKFVAWYDADPARRTVDAATDALMDKIIEAQEKAAA